MFNFITLCKYSYNDVSNNESRLYKIHLELKYERCNISQDIGGGKSLSQATQDYRSRKGICHEGIVDKVRSIWIRTQIAFKGTAKGIGRTKNC